MKRNWIIRDQHALKRLLTLMGRFEIVKPIKVTIEHYRSKRTLAQNSKMWAMLADISRQVEWHGRWLSPEDWKIIFSAALMKQESVPSLDGTGFVVLGVQTSKFSTTLMSELIEIMYAFGAEHEVEWSEHQEAKVQKVQQVTAELRIWKKWEGSD
jgi:hypothetical protein